MFKKYLFDLVRGLHLYYFCATNNATFFDMQLCKSFKILLYNHKIKKIFIIVILYIYIDLRWHKELLNFYKCFKHIDLKRNYGFI